MTMPSESRPLSELLSDALSRVKEAPLRDRRWALLALAQYQTGRQADALLTLHQARRMLVDEAGVEPGPDLVALEQAILRQDPALVAAAALPEPSTTCPYLGLVPYDIGDADAFFGRESEVEQCLQTLSRVGALAVVGPSGSTHWPSMKQPWRRSRNAATCGRISTLLMLDTLHPWAGRLPGAIIISVRPGSSRPRDGRRHQPSRHRACRYRRRRTGAGQ